MYEILSPGLEKVGEVAVWSSDNHSIHWQEPGTITFIAPATAENQDLLQNDSYILVRDEFRQAGRLDALYLICNVSLDEDKNELTINGKTAPQLLNLRAIGTTVLTDTTAGAAMAGLMNSNARGLPLVAAAERAGDAEVIRYPMDGGALGDQCFELMAAAGIGMEAVLDGNKIKILLSPGRDISEDISVPVLGKQTGRSRNGTLTIDSSDYSNVAVGQLVFQSGSEEAFAYGPTDTAGMDRREFYVGDINQQSGEAEDTFRARAKTEALGKLLDHLLRVTISADISPADYGRPYLVGDIVRVQVGPVTIKKRITAAAWLRDQNNDSVTLTLGDQLSTVVTEIKEQQKAITSSVRGSGGVGASVKDVQKRQDGIEMDYQSLIAEVTDIHAGMAAYCLNKVFEDYKEAAAELFAALQDDDAAIYAELRLHASSIEGVQEATADLTARTAAAEASILLKADESSVAAIKAEVIKLQGRVDLTGTLSIRDGGGITCSGAIYAPNQTISGGTLRGQDIYASRYFVFRDVSYEPTEITSTSGTVLVLGTA